MTITTNSAPQHGEKEFSRRPATSQLETTLTLVAGAALAGIGLWASWLDGNRVGWRWWLPDLLRY